MMGKAIIYNQFYYIGMLSQYYLLVEANRLTGESAINPPQQSRLLLLKEIQKALSLSLNLYALSKQESKVRLLAQPPNPLSSPLLFSNIPPHSPLRENSPISVHYKDFSTRKYSCSTKDHICQNKHDPPKDAVIGGERYTDRSQQYREKGSPRKAEKKIKIRKIVSNCHFKYRARMALRKTKKEEAGDRLCLQKGAKMMIASAIIVGKLTDEVIKSKKMELMKRWVLSWNPDKEEAYIKSREFRMLLRN